MNGRTPIYNSNNNIITTTTTGADLRRPITSPVTAAILLALEAGPATTEQLAIEVERLTGRRVKPKDILRYLNYYQQKGWVTNSSPLWSLTEIGKFFVNKYKEWLQQLIGEFLQGGTRFRIHTKPDGIISYGNENPYETTHSTNTNKIIEKIKRFLKDRDEERTVRRLIEHFYETGSTYMYIDELAEELNMEPNELYRFVLRRLRSRRLVYVWRDGKVGLGSLLRRLVTRGM